MSSKLQQLIMATGVALALSPTNGAFAEKAISGTASDARLEARISTIFAFSPHLQAGDIAVSVRDGKATLTGTVPESINKELAEQFARNLEGVKEVDNQLVVDADYVRRLLSGICR